MTLIRFAALLLLAAWDADAPAKFFGPSGLGLVRTIVPGGDPYGLAFSPDGRRLAVGVGNAAVVYETETWGEVRRLQGHPNVILAVAWSPDGKTIAAGGFEGVSVLWDATTGALRARLEGHSSYVGALAFSPDGRSLLTGSHDGSIRLWNPEDGREKNLLVPPGPAGALSLAFSRDGRRVVSGFGNGELRLWNAERLEVERTIPVPAGGNIVATGFSRDGSRVWAATDASFFVYGTSTGTEQVRHEFSVNGLGCLVLSPDDRYAIAGSNDQAVRVHDLFRKGEEAVKLQHHSGALSGVALRPDGRIVATIAHDRHLKIWGRVPPGVARIRPKGFCGIRVQADANGRVIIADVIAGTAAQAAGIRQNDVLRSVGGVEIHNTTESVDRIGSYFEGDELEFVIERQGVVQSLKFRLGKRPDDLEN